MSQWLRELRDWWGAHFLGAETGVAFGLTIALAIWVLPLDGQQDVDQLLAARRGTLYGTAASILATLLGFVLATAAIVLSFAESERFRVLRESPHYPTLWKTFTSAIRALALATISAIVALVIDREPPNDNVLIMLIFAFGLIWAIFRVARTTWALERIIRIATTPVGGSPPTGVDRN